MKRNECVIMIWKVKKTVSYKIDKNLCIICQKQKDTDLTSTANGQTQVKKWFKKAVEIQQDIVWDRLTSAEKDFFFMLTTYVDNLWTWTKLMLIYSLLSIVLVVIGLSLFICEINSYTQEYCHCLWLHT